MFRTAWLFPRNHHGRKAHFIKVFTTAMYTPKIDEELIPRLYRLRKLKKMPMTRLVNEILRSVLPSLEEEERKKEFVCSNTDKENARTTA